MKKHLSIILIIVSLATVFSSCNRKKYDANLVIYVTEIDGQPVEGAEVTLYKSREDYENRKNKVKATQTTNEDGFVKFEWIQELGSYWYYVEKECRTNVLTSNRVSLKSGDSAIVHTKIANTATYTIANKSRSDYAISINSYDRGIIKTDESKVFHFFPSPTEIAISVVAKQKVVFFADVKRKSETLVCGDDKRYVIQ